MKSVDRQALLIPLCLSRRFWGPIAPIRATDSAGMTCSSRPTTIFLSCTFTSQNNAEADKISDTPAMKQVFTHCKIPQYKSSFIEEWKCCGIRWSESEADHLPPSEAPRVLRMRGKYAATPPYAFVTWCLTGHNSNALPGGQIKNVWSFATISQQPLHGMASKKA